MLILLLYWIELQKMKQTSKKNVFSPGTRDSITSGPCGILMCRPLAMQNVLFVNVLWVYTTSSR